VAYRDGLAAAPAIRIVYRPVLRMFLLLLLFAGPVMWEGFRYAGPRFHVTCDRSAGVVDCELRERDPIGWSSYPVRNVRDARVGFIPNQNRGTTFAMVGNAGDAPMVARTNDSEGARRTAENVRSLIESADATGRVDEAFGPFPMLLFLALAILGLGTVAAVRALRRVEFVVTRGELRATSVGRGAPQVSRTVRNGPAAAVRLRGEAKTQVMEVVSPDGTPQVLADVGWLSASRARALCARVEEAVARAHA
jgi:hypothetical protein